MVFEIVSKHLSCSLGITTVTIVILGILAQAYLLDGRYYYSETKVSHEERLRSAVLVTGANRGIGRQIAEDLSDLGYTVLGTVRCQRQPGSPSLEGSPCGHLVRAGSPAVSW